jgi:phage gpG-like protein
LLEFEQKGLKSFTDNLKKVDVREIVKNTMRDAEKAAKEYAVGYAPKDTGELAESIYTVPIKDGFIIGASVRYAVFNEYGSIYTPVGTIDFPLPAKKVGVRPFIRPAMRRVQQEFPKLQKKHMERVLHG